MSERRSGMEAFGLSRRGRVRERNEDRFVVRDVAGGVLLGVADGLGGTPGGEEAAEQAARALETFAPGPEPGRALLTALLAANSAIHEQRVDGTGPENMGTTLTTAYVRSGRTWYAHAGDCRIYHLRRGQCEQITRDHTAFRAMLDSGAVSEALVMKHLGRDSLEQCLGCPDLAPDVGRLDLGPGEVLLICSDGLYGELGPQILHQALVGGPTLRLGVLELAAAAMAAGARDNVTLAAVRL